MEYGPENNIFVLKMMISGLEKIILKFLHAQAVNNKWIYYIEKLRVTNSVTKMTIFAHGGISIKLFMVNLHIIN